MKTSTPIMAKDFSKKKSTLSSESPRTPSETPSETTNTSSSISILRIRLLNYFSKNCWCPRRNSENTASFLISNKPIEAESTSSGSKENQIPDGFIENNPSGNSSTKTNSLTRWISPLLVVTSLPLLVSVAYMLFKDQINNIFSRLKNGEDPNQTGSTNFHTRKHLTRPEPLHQPGKVPVTDQSLTYPRSQNERDADEFSLKLSNGMEYTYNYLEMMADSLTTISEDTQSTSDTLKKIYSVTKQQERKLEDYIKNSKKHIETTTIGAAIVGFISGCLLKSSIYRLFSRTGNDNGPIQESPDHQNHPVPPKPIIEKLSAFDLSDDELSCSSTGSASSSPRRATNSTENFLPPTSH